MQEIFNRLFSPTPDFFKRIRMIGLSLASLATLIVTLQSNGVHIPGWLTYILNMYTLVGGSVAVFVSQLTKIWTDPNGIPLNSSLETFDFETAMQMVQNGEAVKRLVWDDSTYIFLVREVISITRNGGITYLPYDSTIEDRTKTDWIGTTPKDR